MIKFDLATILTKLTIVRYFKKGLKPSIKAKIDQNATQLNDYKELIAKAVKTGAKIGLKPSFYI